MKSKMATMTQWANITNPTAIGFPDPENMCIATKIMPVSVSKAEICAKVI